MSEIIGGTRRGVDVVFSPGAVAMYPKGVATAVEVGSPLTSGLCSAFRPGHFRGVATVIAKLFHIVSPHAAFFGQKDAQQVAVIRRMVMDLDMGVRVRVLPTVRESDGLAMSSRNRNLSPSERSSARVLFKALSAGRFATLRGETRPAAVRREMLRALAREPRVRVQYLAVVDADTMHPVSRIRGKVLLAVAAWVGRTRLIDNVPVRPFRRRAGGLR